MTPVSVLVVDDHPVVRYGLVSMLQTDRGINVVGSAGDGEDALAKVAALSPEVVLLDIHMPVMDGLTATKQIKERFPRTSVVILTLYHNEQYVVEAIRSGAAGYLLKTATRDEICKTLKDLSSGGFIIKTTMLQKALNGAVSEQQATRPDLDFRGQPWGADGDFEKLTAREAEVLQLLVEGMTNKEIGRKLIVTEDTVKKHVQNIILKLHVSDRTQAAVKAVRLGLAH